MPSALLMLLIVCGGVCLLLGRSHRWYWLGWLPLFIGCILSALFCLATFGSSVGIGPEAGFAAMGRSYATLILLPAALLAPVLWLVRPRSEPSTVTLIGSLGCLGLIGILLKWQTTQPVTLQLVQADGMPASGVYVSIRETVNGTSRDGPMRRSDARGAASFRVRDLSLTEFHIHKNNLMFGYRPAQQDRKTGLWFCRWDHVSGTYATELEDQQPFVVCLPGQDHLLSPFLMRQIETWLMEAQARQRLHLPNFGGCPEGLEFGVFLRDLVMTRPDLHEDLEEILVRHAALLSQLERTVDRHRERATTAPALQPLLTWSAEEGKPGNAAQLQVRLDELRRQILETCEPLLKTEDAWKLRETLCSMRLPWSQLAPLLEGRSLNEVLTLLQDVSNWPSPADATEALAMLERLETLQHSSNAAHQQRPSPRLERVKSQLLKASRQRTR